MLEIKEVEIKEVNGFKIDNTLNPHQFAGYFTRDCYLFVKYIDLSQNVNHSQNITRLLENKIVNGILFSHSMGSMLLENYKKRIEEPIDYIKKIGKELIEDYNWKYITYCHSYSTYSYFNTPKMCLIRLEQIFILNDWPTWYIFELIKPNLRHNDDNKNIFNMINIITDLDINKIRKLKEYLDEYFYYVFDRTKNIYRINKLILPIDWINKIEIEQFAAYLVRSSNVILEYIDNFNIVSINNIEANESFMSWVKAIFGNDSIETKKISEYRLKIENPTESITNLENQLSLNLEQKQYLIYLEQSIIRHKLEPSIVIDYTKRRANIINQEMYNWIKEITNLKSKKIEVLKEYLDKYKEYILQKTED